MNLYITYGIDMGQDVADLKNYCFSVIYASIKAVCCAICGIRFVKNPVFLRYADILKTLLKTVSVIMSTEYPLVRNVSQHDELWDNKIPFRVPR